MKAYKLSIFALFILLLSACGGKEETTVKQQNQSKPNILLVIADDMGIDASPGYSSIGTTKPNMPNLTNLMNNGITFDNAWVFPMCSPTRASILTGKYGFRTGVLNVNEAATIKSSEKTIQKYLDEKLGSAYAHSIIGKWHLSNKEPNQPVEMGVGHYEGLLGGAVDSYSEWSFTSNGATNKTKDYITSKFTDSAIDWIKKQEKPWFCWLAYTTPHTPFHLPPSGTHKQGDLPTDQASIDANPTPYFMAMMENLDYEMGRVLKSMPQEQLDNTVIIFIGDNGTTGKVIQSPYSSNRSKGTIHEGGIHVPLIVSGKGVSRKGKRDANLINSTDLFATIAQIAGVTDERYEDSYSFYKLFSNSTSNNRDYNYSEVLNTKNKVKSGYTIRNKTYKLMVLDNNTSRFYNLEKDPYEDNNLLSKTLSKEEQTAHDELKAKAETLRSSK